MNYTKTFFGLFLATLLVAGAVPAAAEVFFQCPGYVPGVSIDTNSDGALRFRDGELPGAFTLPNGFTDGTLPVNQDVICMHLVSGDGFVNMADKSVDPAGKLQYIFGFANATTYSDGNPATPDPVVPADQVMGNFMLKMELPAPTITLRQGDHFYLTLSNVGMVIRPDLFDPHTVHYHGFPNASAFFDGEPMSSISINMGASLTYYYQIVEPGTFLYHCHVEATEHMQMGMLGNLYVTPAQDGTDLGGFTTFAYNDGDGSTGYDVDYPVQIQNFDPNFHDASLNVQPLPFAAMEDLYPMFNGRGYPDTVNTGVLINSETLNPSQKVNTLITASPGERILLRISSLATTSFHTLTTSGIPMLVVGKDARKLGPPGDTSQYIRTNSITLGGGEAVDVILDTLGIPAGTYFLYTSNVNHLNNNTEEYGGMMTEIRIAP